VDAFVKGKIDLPSKSVVVTIDDGSKSFYTYAIPILKKYKVGGTGFVITQHVKKRTVKKYKKGLISLQSHSQDLHRRNARGRGIMTSLPKAAIKRDLKESVRILGKNDAFAYPFGHYNGTAIKAVKATGFHEAFTTQSGRVYPGMNRLLLPRVRVNANTSLSTFKGLVK
jgi:peptidoglycan/xylan/chitin deacetylase (PgdA/CDA1 family)